MPILAEPPAFGEMTETPVYLMVFLFCCVSESIGSVLLRRVGVFPYSLNAAIVRSSTFINACLAISSMSLGSSLPSIPVPLNFKLLFRIAAGVILWDTVRPRPGKWNLF